ncbi:tyrosine-type recombinase/integrase [Chryseobacterium gambrini]|uniref:Integrase/recombinase XerD n=1 Tax=Chryseobacterium gambrini TaxID=373672 RepID=A0A1N7QZU2_9FLAO|nr:tyrosine-type recombinase/integrase [Chryseobacterium gambrini]SIT28362.1 integrase/recombinase XerD [Chryseobacterium gambrini]
MNETILQFRKELQNLGYCKTVINSYPKHIARFLEYTRKDCSEVQTKDILDYYSYLKTIISKRTKKPLSGHYLHSILLAVKLYFDYLQRAEIQKINPYQLKIKAPRSEERKVFSYEEIKKLYAKSSSLQTIILHLCYACGLRRTEAVSILLKDIDLENGLLYIRKGKGRKRRVIPFTKQVQKDLKDFIFLSGSKESLLGISAAKLYYEFTKLLKKTGLENKRFTLHCLRHSIATHLLEQGMELEKVRDFLGHEYLGTTQIYTRVNDGA